MTDLISRESAIALLRGLLLPDSIGHDAETLAQNYGIEQAIEALANMPSAGVHIELKAAQGSGVYGYSIYEDKP